MYTSYARNLTREQALANIKALLTSDYFCQCILYDFNMSTSFYRFMSRYDGNRDVSLRDVKAGLDGLIDNLMQNNSIEFTELVLKLNLSQKQREKIIGEYGRWCHMLLNFRVDKTQVDYKMVVSARDNSGGANPKEREQLDSMYNQWHREVNDELQRVLPHKLKK